MFVEVEVLLLLLVLVDVELTVEVEVEVEVEAFVLFVFTVLVLVEVLFVSTNVFESYVVCANENLAMETNRIPISIFFIVVFFLFCSS